MANEVTVTSTFNLLPQNTNQFFLESKAVFRCVLWRISADLHPDLFTEFAALGILDKSLFVF